MLSFSLVAIGDSNRVLREGRLTRSGDRAVQSVSYPLFAFAPLNGAGMSAPCAGTPITAATGQAITNNRLSAATCNKQGIVTTGINNGDVVKLTNNQPRVMPNEVGVLGILVERTIQNNFTWSEDFSSGNWIKYRDGAVALPIVTADTTTAPDNDATADTITLPATAGSQSSIIYQSTCTIGAQCSLSFFVKGVSGSGTLDVCAGTSGVACQPCTYNSSTWSRCTRTGLVASAASAFIGNATQYNGGIARPAQDVYIWGAQSENSPFVSSYMPTTSSAATRLGDVVQSDLGAGFAANGTSFSMAVTNSGFQDSVVSVSNSAYWSLSPLAFTDPSGKGSWAYQNVNGQVCIAVNDAGSAFTSNFTSASTSALSKRWSCWSAGTVNGNYAGTVLTPSATQTGVFSPMRYLNIGNSAGSTTYIRPGIYTNMCISADSAECR